MAPPAEWQGGHFPHGSQLVGLPPVDRALETVVGAINALTELQDDGPGVVLTLGGLIVSGTVIPDWQWFDEVEHAARAAFVVHTGGSVDDEHGGWARLFEGVAESLVQARDEHRAAREATERLSDRYRHLLAREDRTHYIHLRDARVIDSRRQSAAGCGDALARAAVGGLGMVLRPSRPRAAGGNSRRRP